MVAASVARAIAFAIEPLAEMNIDLAIKPLAEGNIAFAIMPSADVDIKLSSGQPDKIYAAGETIRLVALPLSRMGKK